MRAVNDTSERVLEGEVLAPESEEQRRTRERLAFIAWLLDSSIPIPGTRFTIGLDALIGLVPFIGDLIGVIASSYILGEAHRLGVGRAILARMALNVALEGVIGIVPFAGDAFDAAWKANEERAAAERLGRAAARNAPYERLVPRRAGRGARGLHRAVCRAYLSAHRLAPRVACAPCSPGCGHSPWSLRSLQCSCSRSRVRGCVSISFPTASA